MGVRDGHRLPQAPPWALGAVLLAALLAVACSNSPYPPEPEGVKILYAALAEDPRQGLDPVAITDTVGAGLVGQIYDSLYEYHYLKRPYEVKPCLAADLPALSDDRKTMTIPIAQGIYFYDPGDPLYDPARPVPGIQPTCFGESATREVVAEDFVYALKRMADVNSGSRNYWLIEGKIEGLDAFHAASQEIAGRSMDLSPEAFQAELDALYARDVPGVQAPERYTLVIGLVEPFPQLKYVLAMCNCAAQAREAVEYYGCHDRAGRRSDYFKHPVGTGPYTLKEWREQQRIVFVRNPTYREEYYPAEGEAGDAEAGLLADAGKRLPFVDEIWHTVVRESLPAWIYFRQGYLDLSGIPPDSFSEAVTVDEELSPQFLERGIQLIRSEELTLFWKMFNMDDPEIGDGPRTADGGYLLDKSIRDRNRKIRQAMSLGYQRERIVRVFLNGRGTLATGPIPKGMYGYDVQGECPYLVYNPEAARRTLAEAGYTDGTDAEGNRLKFVFDMQSAHPLSRQMTQAFVKDMADIGIEIEIRSNTWAEYLRRTREGRFQIADSGWNLDYPDPENFLQLLYGGNRPPKSNNAAFWNAEYDRLYEKMRDMPDGPERLAAIERMVDIVHEECPWLFGYSRVAFILVPPWRKNYKPHNISGGYVKYQDVDVALRSELRARWNRPWYVPLATLAVAAAVGVVVLARLRAPTRGPSLPPGGPLP